MNNLEKYIGDLNPSCWLNSEHINGYGITQPNDGDQITEWKDISGNSRNATSINPGIFIKDNTGIAKLQGNISGIQASNSLNDISTYKGSQFTITGIDKASNNFTTIIIGSVQVADPSDWNGILYITNRFSLSSANGAITHNTCLSINNNSNSQNIINIHNFNWQIRYGILFGTRPQELFNLLGLKQTFHPIIWTYNDTTGIHTFYDQHRQYQFNRVLTKPNNNDYNIIVFNNLLDSATVPSYRRHGIGQEFAFWNKLLNESEIKQAQTYLKLKYNI